MNWQDWTDDIITTERYPERPDYSIVTETERRRETRTELLSSWIGAVMTVVYMLATLSMIFE